MKKFVLFVAFIAVMVSCGSKNTEQAQAEPEKKSVWTEKEYVDEFGAPSGQKYLQTEVDGYFSNSATTNSPLKVLLTVAPDSTIEVALIEYGSHMVKDQDHDLKVRHNNDTIYDNWEYLNIGANGWGNLAYKNNNRNHFGDKSLFMLEGGKYEISLREKSRYKSVLSTYHFTIEDGIIQDALQRIAK